MKYIFTTAVLLLSLGVFAQNMNGLDFDGSNDMVQTTAPPISGNTAKTIEAWIKTTANCVPANGGHQIVIVDMGTTATGSRFTFNLLYNNAPRIEVAGSGVSGNNSVNDGNWHHVAGVYDPNASLKFLLYVDGVLDTAANNTTAVNTSTSGNIRIGTRIDNVNYFDGVIDEVRIWNVARTGAQIAADRNKEYCTLPAGLVAYYQFNQGSPASSNTGLTTLTDAVNAYNGTLSGFSLSGSSSNWVNGATITPGLTYSKMNQSVCDSLVSPSGLYVWKTSGNKTDTLVNTSGCDSIIKINLTVNQSQYSVINDTVCGPYHSPSGKYTYMNSGKYFDTTTTSKGCAHVHELNLDITIVDTNVTMTGHQLSSNQAGATHYIWLDCNDNYAQISGTNNQVFNPTKDGSYAVRVTVEQCVDTSQCFDVYGIGIEESGLGYGITIYPVPAGDVLNVQFNENVVELIIEVINADGQRVISKSLNDSDRLSLNTGELSSGMYVIRMVSDRGIFQKSFIKE